MGTPRAYYSAWHALARRRAPNSGTNSPLLHPTPPVLSPLSTGWHAYPPVLCATRRPKTTLERIGVAAHPLPGGYAPPALSTGDDVASFVYLYHLARRPVLNVEHVALTASRALAYYEHEVQTNEDLREITHLWKFLVHM